MGSTLIINEFNLAYSTLCEEKTLKVDESYGGLGVGGWGWVVAAGAQIPQYVLSKSLVCCVSDDVEWFEWSNVTQTTTRLQLRDPLEIYSPH